MNLTIRSSFKKTKLVAKLKTDFGWAQGEAEACTALNEESSIIESSETKKNGSMLCKLLGLGFTTARWHTVRSRERACSIVSGALADLRH